MNLFDLIFGAFALLTGLYTFYLRFTGGFQDSVKLQEMKSRFGEKGGDYLHMFAYTVLPLTVGIVFLYLYFR